ncbi:AAA family ATPase [Actinosynnema sp. NPDC053489]|uniref:nucleotide-binding protein n=1 Tax=Actinosynnema sp. NPDC053489 TaxID=3363916 RepID=UPI0037CC41AC
MDDEPLQARRRRAGAPPKIHKEVLRNRYGQHAVDLVIRLRRLQDEAGFTDLEAARRWAANEPEAAHRHKVLKPDGAVDRKRLSEFLHMDKGPIPAGLVGAFHTLWADQHAGDTQTILRTADELSRLCRLVAAAADRAAQTPPPAAKTKALAKSTQIDRLKDELIEVGRDLIQTKESRNRFSSLSAFLFEALIRLQSTHQQLIKERDDLLAKLHDAESVARAVQDAQIAGEQLARAEHQLDQARRRAREVEELNQQLQARYRMLAARLAEMESPVEVHPTAAALASTTTTDLPEADSLAENQAVLDRVDDMLHEDDEYLARTRQRLAHDDLTTFDSDIVDASWEVRGMHVQDNPDNRATWLFPRPGDADNSTPAPSAMPPWANVRTGDEHAPAPVRRRRAMGWRDTLRTLTGGLIQLGPSPDETRREELIARITRPMLGNYKIAVLSLKGGVGKTTVTAALGATLATLRKSKVIAVDADPDRGTLALKVPRETTATVRHVLRDAGKITEYLEVRQYTSRAQNGLEVLASEQDPAIAETFSDHDYLTLIGTLQPYYEIVLTDSGTGLTHSAMKGVLEQADVLVLVSSGSVDGAQTSAATLDWLEAHGYRDLVARSVTVINSVRPGSGRIDLDKLADHFAQRCRAVVRLPFDQHLEEGIEVDLGELEPATRLALLEFAATVADDFPSPPPPSYTESAHVTVRPPEKYVARSTPRQSSVSGKRIPPDTIPWVRKIRELDLALARAEVSSYEHRMIREWLLDTADALDVPIKDSTIRQVINELARTIWHDPARPRAVGTGQAGPQRVLEPSGDEATTASRRSSDPGGTPPSEAENLIVPAESSRPGEGAAATVDRPNSHDEAADIGGERTTPDSWSVSFVKLINQYATGEVSTEEYRSRRASLMRAREKLAADADQASLEIDDWQKNLRFADTLLAAGEITGDEYRYVRDEILKVARGERLSDRRGIEFIKLIHLHVNKEMGSYEFRKQVDILMR